MKRCWWVVMILIVGLICACAPKENENITQSENITQNGNVTEEGTVVGEIDLSADTNKVTTNGGDTGTTKITIQVTDLEGVGIVKKVSLTSTLGTLKDVNGNEISEITTNSYGQAEFYFESGENCGNATITAEADGVSSKIEIEVVKIGAISLTADKQYLLKNDSTLLHVQVTDIYGNPATGIKVKVTSENESVASIGVDILTTNDKGEATIYATAGEPQKNTDVTIRAQSGDKTSKITLSVVAPDNITISVTPTTINTGGETATINAWVTEEGQGIPQVQVSFSTTLGEIDPTVVTTNNNGVATAYLTSDDSEGIATITAKAGDLEVQTQVTIIKSDVVNVPTSIEVENIETTKIYVQGSGNKETCYITFKVFDGKGNPVKDARIQFSLVGGSLGGEYLVPTSGVTDENGEITITLKAGTKPGTVKIKAWYNDEVYTETEGITICSGPAEGMHLSMAVKEGELNIIGLKADGVEAEIFARLADLYSNPVPEGTAVHFESQYAKIEGSDTSTGAEAPEQGVVNATLFSQDPKPVNGAPVHVWVQTQSGDYACISGLYVNGDILYAGTDGGGVFKSIDGGENWENIGRPRSYTENLKGLWGTYINDISIKGNLIVVATEEGVFYSEDGGYNWRNLQSKSDRWTDYVSNAKTFTLTYYPINFRERIDVKKDGNPYIAWNIIGKIFSSKDIGNYTITYDIDYGTPFTPSRLIKILDENTFFAYFVGEGIWKFDKTQLHWFDFNQGLSQKDVSTMVFVDTNNDGNKDTIYVTVGGQVYKSSVINADFQSVGSAQPVSFNDAFVFGTDIYYATTEGIKKFDTATNSWSDILFTNCPVDNIKHIVLSDNGTIYIGTDLGLYRIEEGDAYPLDVYKERLQYDNDTREISLSYPCDQDKTHTTVYVNGVEIPSSYYEFDNETIIRIRDEVDPIRAGDIVEVYYTLKPASSNYVSVPQKKITALYYSNNKLYFGTENRKVYVIENAYDASNAELPQIKDISGLTNKITSIIYKTTQVMFTGDTVIQALWDTNTDGYFDNGPINLPNGGSIDILVLVSDINGRPLVADSQINFSCDVGKLIAQDSTLPDVQYGGYGITEYVVILTDDDSNETEPSKSGSLEIEVTSKNGSKTMAIPVTVD